MATQTANILEVVVGNETPTIYSLALFDRDKIKIAMFVEKQLDLTWKPIAIPTVFVTNPALLRVFLTSLAEQGYILDTCTRPQ
jgi:hypothetical protein